MILTCPACSTRYVVKDGSIPPEGRQVRCAACKHRWHQDGLVGEGTEREELGDPAAPDQAAPDEVGSAPEAPRERDDAEPVDHAADWHSTGAVVDAESPAEPLAESPIETLPQAEPAPLPVPPEEQEPFEPIPISDEEPPSYGAVKLLVALLVVAALAAAAYMFAPAEWRARLGLGGPGETPLLLQVRNSDRQQLASGNELFAVSGRVINPTEERHAVPPLQAELRDGAGKVLYRWTIPPPAPSLGPGASASFNSAEVDVPKGAEQLTVTLGKPVGA